MEQTEKPVRVEQTEKMEKPAAEAPKASASDGAGSAARALSESMDPVFGDTDSSASRQYRQHVSSVNQTIADAQERIARMLGELQRDVDGE
ncbi:MAG: hypothetical protein Q4C65_08435 [Eubacteriales bacterium]|nr:hypothetical protein [Eubacteriales bacterium]